MRVLSFGEVLYDIIQDETLLGGAPLNFAAHSAKLGAEVYMLSKVGNDGLGDQAVEAMESMGIQVDFVGRDALHPTGTVEVTLEDGHPDYIIHEDVAYDFIEIEDWEKLKSQKFDVLYFGSLVQRASISAISLDRILRDHRFTHVFYDVNLRKNCYTKNIIKRSLDYCTIFKLSDEEIEEVSKMLYGDAIEMEEFMRMVTNDFDISTVIVTAGAEGSYILHDSLLSFIKAYPAQVSDTVGAGDSFSAAFVHTFIKTEDPIDSVDKANYMGAFVASSKGAIPEYSEEIKKEFKL